MKRNGPLITLLLGAGLAAVLFLLSMQATRISNAATGPVANSAAAGDTAAVPPPSGPDPVPGTEPVPARSAPVPDAPEVAKEPLARPASLSATWAGRLRPGSLAISINDGKAIAYLCDGKRLEAWLKGTATDGSLALTGKNGATLVGRFSKSQATGTVTVRDRTTDFRIKAVKKPSGLYRFAAKVRDAEIVGGWIVLDNGSQVGLATVSGVQTRPSALDLTTRTAKINGIMVSAVSADGSR
jgi:hypothetical protein